VLAFEHDVDSPPRYAQEAAQQIPAAEYVEIAGSGHIGIVTHAEQVAERLIEFLGRH
jgi:pimeloyl-ACP methyl ester carboxylesterase